MIIDMKCYAVNEWYYKLYVNDQNKSILSIVVYIYDHETVLVL